MSTRVNPVKFKAYMVYEGITCGVLLPNDVNYSNLVMYVGKKFKVSDINGIRLSYNVGSNKVDIIDDEDLDFFLDRVFESMSDVQTIFITQSEQTSQVTPSSSSNKPLAIDLNRPLLAEHAWQRNTFTSMPIPPHAPTVDVTTKNKHNIVPENATKLNLHDRFDDKGQCIYVIALKCIREGYEHKVVKSCTARYYVRCT